MSKAVKLVRHLCCVRCFARLTAPPGKDARVLAEEEGWTIYQITKCSNPWICKACSPNDEGSQNCDPSKIHSLAVSARSVRAQDGVGEGKDPSEP